MNIRTCSKMQAENYVGTPDTHVISIRTPRDTRADLDTRWGWITFVEFPDDDSTPDPHLIQCVVDAVTIAIGNGSDLLIHCGLGVSRSVGTARAITRALNEANIECTYVTDPPFRGNITLEKAIYTALSENFNAKP